MAPDSHLVAIICVLDCIILQSVRLSVRDPTLQEAFLHKAIWLARANGKQVEVTCITDSGDGCTTL